jgi:membrane fusion protein (multidrug efflux system)
MTLPKSAQLISGLVLAGAIFGGALILNRSEADASMQTTDDAYVRADFTVVAPQISGTVARVLVEDHAIVKAGELLAVLDDREPLIDVAGAKAEVMNSQAQIESLQAQLKRQDTVIREAQAAINADDAALVLAQANVTRYRGLAADGSGTVQALEEAESQLRIHTATRERDVAKLQAARQQIEILRANLQRARAALAQSEAALASAELNLSHTKIIAPIAGTVGRRSVRVGAYVNEGDPLLAIVPLDSVYVEANFRETQLARVRAGQPVQIEVDALPGVTLRGHVESLGPASGVSFSPIAPHNATGNFTKIVQRLPVRIRIDPSQPAAEQLRVGMSVQPQIDCS